jgi:hypothetical protein
MENNLAQTIRLEVNMKKVLLLTLLFVATPTTTAQQNACGSPEYRQFDFWLGNWEVRSPTGEALGSNRITQEFKGCVIQEFWQGAQGGTGSSWNYFSPQSGKWHQSWVSDYGDFALLVGEYKNEAMMLEGTSKTPNGQTLYQRATWRRINNNPDEVQQLVEISRNNTTWQTAFDGRYFRKKP